MRVVLEANDWHARSRRGLRPILSKGRSANEVIPSVGELLPRHARVRLQPQVRFATEVCLVRSGEGHLERRLPVTPGSYASQACSVPRVRAVPTTSVC